MQKIMLIKIEQIRIDGGTQQRAEIDYSVVDDYASAMTDGATLPPVTVVFDGTVYWLVDGFHRWHASRKAGFLDIEATIKNGSQRDAVLLSLGVNHAHGLRRSNADKRKAVETMLNDPEWRDFSNCEIAKNCYVSESLVRSLRDNFKNSFKTSQPQTPPQAKAPEPEKQPTKPAPPVAPAPPEDDGAPEDYTEIDQLRDMVSEQQDTIAQLADRCAKLGDTELPLAEMYDTLKKENAVLLIQVEMITRSRDQLQNENAELMKQVKYLQKKLGK
jgi:hypothetical protein